jgi:pSer/pThr/pTyr-binding forkhead associated (FHA) protein
MVDTGSRNGTMLNGERVSGSIGLKQGDRIGVGSDLLEVVEVEAEPLAVAIPPSGNEEVTRSVRGLHIGDVVPFLIDECAKEGRAQAVLPQLRDALDRFTELKSGTSSDDIAKLRGLLRAARVRIEHPEFQTWVESALAKLS